MAYSCPIARGNMELSTACDMIKLTGYCSDSNIVSLLIYFLSSLHTATTSLPLQLKINIRQGKPIQPCALSHKKKNLCLLDTSEEDKDIMAHVYSHTQLLKSSLKHPLTK